MEGTRPRGRPRWRWMDNVQEIRMELTQSQEVDWNTSYDRERWRGLVLAAKSLNDL